VRRAAALVAALALVVAAAGCGDGGNDKPRLTVAAASSLKKAFTDYGDTFKDLDVRLSFAGSDKLAAQIRAGVRPDVYAAANTELPEALFKEGLVEKPVTFASTRLLVAVPRSGSKVTRFEDLARPGVKIAVGTPSVPIGSYTRRVLAKLPQGKAIEANVRDQEPDVASVVAKVLEGAVDAAFVYATDVRPALDRLKAIEIPIPTLARYAAAVVRGARHPDSARRFVAALPVSKELRAAGFNGPHLK
jgi:molybdate transport system substrate-binding protein